MIVLFKNYLKCYGYLFGLIIIFTLILSIINYFIPFKATIIKIIIPVISIFISSIILGRKVKTKAYFEGIKFSLLYLLLITIIKFIIKTSFNYKAIIIYLLMIFTSVIGSMIGINLKKG